jgi:hypothetical protein
MPQVEATLCAPDARRVPFAAVVLSLALGACAHGPAPVLARPDTFHRGVALGLFDSDSHLDEDLERLREIRDLGASHVSLVITWTQDDIHASRVTARPGYTASRDSLVRLVRRARSLGLRVLVFPIVRLLHRTPSQWRGLITPTDPAAWFASYGGLLDELATLSAEEGVAALSIGSELVALETRADDWRALIASVRGRFHGQLLYSANWDRYANVRVWDQLDLIGVSAYWDLTPHGRRPTVEEIDAAWRPIQQAVTGFARRCGRPVVFTEFGYPSVVGGGASPWNDFADGADGVEDAETQRRLYDGFARAWNDEPTLAGAYAWIWFGRGGLGDRSYTPRHKPAEQVLRTWYRDPRTLPPPR